MRASCCLRTRTAPRGAGSDSQIASAAHTSIPTIGRVRRICVEHGLERALDGKDPEREYPRKLEGKGEAQLIALCCGAAPQGPRRRRPGQVGAGEGASRARWTLRLLAARLVELEIVDTICREAVRQRLKKTNSSRGRRSSG